MIHANTIPTLHFMDTSKLISVMQNCSLFNYITIQITSLNKIEPSKLKQVWIECITTSGLTILHVLLFTLIIQQCWTITAYIYKTLSQKTACPNETLLKQYIVFTFFTTLKHLITELDYLITYLHTYLFIYSTQQSPSSQANRFSTSQIPRILWNPKVHYRIHKYQPFVPILRKIAEVEPKDQSSFEAFVMIRNTICFTVRSC